MDAIAAKYDGRGSFEKEDWDALLGHCRAVTDIPCAVAKPVLEILLASTDIAFQAFAQELIATYPDAKVVLSNREVEAWHRSTLITVHGQRVSRLKWFLGWFNIDIWRNNNMCDMLWDRMFAGDFPRNGKDTFKRHYEQVRLLMRDRPQDLLEYEVSQGWGPLCKFLEKKVPESEFPRLNDVENFQAWMSAMRTRQAINLTKAAAPILAVLGVVCAASLLGSRW